MRCSISETLTTISDRAMCVHNLQWTYVLYNNLQSLCTIENVYYIWQAHTHICTWTNTIIHYYVTLQFTSLHSSSFSVLEFPLAVTRHFVYPLVPSCYVLICYFGDFALSQRLILFWEKYLPAVIYRLLFNPVIYRSLFTGCYLPVVNYWSLFTGGYLPAVIYRWLITDRYLPVGELNHK